MRTFLLLSMFPFIACGFARAQEAKEDQKRASFVLPGMQAGGKILLPNQWSLRPAGKQLKMGDFPVNIALHPTEPFAAVLHAGYGDHEVVIIELKEL